MKINTIFYISLLVLTLSTVACSGTSVPDKARINDNIFVYPENPDLKVQLPPDMKYAGRAVQVIEAGQDKADVSTRSFEAYVFIGNGEGSNSPKSQKSQKIAFIEIAKITNGFWGNNFSTDQTLYSYPERIESKVYNGVVNIYCDDSEFYVNFFLKEKGYTLSECEINNSLNYIVDQDKNIKVKISYSENFDPKELNHFFQKNEKEKTSEFFASFANKALEAIKILPSN